MNLTLADILFQARELRRIEPSREKWFAAMKIFIHTFGDDESLYHWLEKLDQDRRNWEKKWRGTA